MLVLILIIIITNNKYLSKIFNFDKLNGKSIKFKLLFYIILYLLIHFKKIFYIYIYLFLFFILLYIYILLTTKNFIKIKPIIKTPTNLLYLISASTYLLIYTLLKEKKNYKLLILIIIKLLPNIIFSISLLLLNITYIATVIIYNIKTYSYKKIKLLYFSYLINYEKKIKNVIFYGMKNVNKNLLNKIKGVNIHNTTSNNESLDEIVYVNSINFNGDRLYHPAQIYNINNDIIFVNTMTHKSINKFTKPHVFNDTTKMEAMLTKIEDISQIPKKKHDLLIEKLDIESYPKFKEYLFNLKNYNEELLLKKDTLILNQTDDSKYIKLCEYSNKISVNELIKITNINPEAYIYVETIVKKYEPRFNIDIEYQSEKISAIIKMLNDANKLI